MFGVVADSAIVQAQGGVPQLEGGNAGDANVDGFALDVFAVCGDSAGGAMQECVGLRGTVSADDVDDTAGVPDGLVELIEQVEEARIHVAISMHAPIAEEAVELELGGRHIVIALAVDDVQVAAGVQVVKHEAVGFGRGRLRNGWEYREEREEYSETAVADPRGKSLTTHATILLFPGPWHQADAAFRAQAMDGAYLPMHLACT